VRAGDDDVCWVGDGRRGRRAQAPTRANTTFRDVERRRQTRPGSRFPPGVCSRGGPGWLTEVAFTPPSCPVLPRSCHRPLDSLASFEPHVPFYSLNTATYIRDSLQRLASRRNYPLKCIRYAD
jgi:hypothetical protein